MADENLTPSIDITKENITPMIYDIRGQKVMLDSDLAKIYGYETKVFNQQVKRNIEKFDEDFMFQLTKEESECCLRSQNVTLNESGNMRGQHLKYLPYAFTEQGVYMLMTVLKGELATKQSKALIRLFKSMKEYIEESRGLVTQSDFASLTLEVRSNAKAIEELRNNTATKEDIQKVMENFIDPDSYKEFFILDGQKVEADLAYMQIYKQAKASVQVIDNYIGLKTLELLRSVPTGIPITVFSDNVGVKDKLTKTMYNDFTKEYPSVKIKLISIGNRFHDRYIILDHGTATEKIYHCGASSKDAGQRFTSINVIQDTSVFTGLLTSLAGNPALKLT